MYSDAHTHLTGSPFGDNVLTPEEINIVLKNVREAGVSLIVAGSADLASAKRVAEIAAAEDVVYASIGIHPWIASVLDDATINGFLALAKQPKVVAFGEIGLDESRSRASKEVQLQSLSQLLGISRETGLPPIIHQRGMHKEMMETIGREKAPAGIMHGFSGDAVELQEWLDLGFLIAVGRAVLAPEGQGMKDVVQKIPADRLVLETDGANRTKEGKLEGQERVVQMAEVVASWRGTTGPEIGETTTRNLKRLLKI